MNRALRDKFASKLDSLEQAPESLREPMRRVLKPSDEIRMLILGPAEANLDEVSPATLLAVLDKGWLLVSAAEKSEPAVARSPYSSTVLIELMLLLHYGRLRVVHVVEGVARHALINFSAVMEPLYKEVVRHLLSGIEDIACGAPMSDSRLNILLQGVPTKFCSAAHEFRPFSQRALAVHYWPATGWRIGRFQRELWPAALLLLTERELILISERKKRSWLRVGPPDECGNVATYCPLSRLTGWRIEDVKNPASLKLNVQNASAGLTVEAKFPRSSARELKEFMELAMDQRQAAGIDKESLI